MSTAFPPPSTETTPSAMETSRALYGYVRPHRWMITLGLVCTLAGTAGGLVQPLATKALMDRLTSGQTITAILLALTALVVVGTIADAVGAYVLERTAESVVLAARRTLVGRLLRLRVAEAHRIPPGDLMSRVTSDTTLLRTASTHAIVAAATGSVSFVAAIAIMAVLDATLLAVTVGVLIVVGALVASVMPRIATATQRSQEAVGEVSSGLERAIGAFTTVKASGAEQRESDRIEAAARQAWRHGVTSARWEALVGSADGLAVQLAFLAVLGIGGARVASGAMPVSTLIAFLLYLFYLIEPVSRLVEAVSQFQEGAAAIARINRVNGLSAEPLSRHRPMSSRRTGAASIRFEEVSFRYRPDLPYLYEKVSFDVPAGGTTAVVGPSGSGKSTVLALIERFYEVNAGRVLVDGRDVREWPLAELRSMIGYVQQDAPVLAGTLRDNLTHAAPEASEEQVARVLEHTGLTGLIDRLPRGLDTPVGHRGAALSGGERQRIAIARALLRRPRILLLDEPTSQLDAATEQQLTEVIARAAERTTVVVVAHRLSTVTNADRIIVMADGRIHDVGTHQELTARRNTYARFVALQRP